MEKLSISLPLLVFLSVIFSGSAFATNAATVASTHLVYQFPNGTWVENIAVRGNGHLLVTFVNVPELWTIDPFASPAPTATFIHRFNASRLATGIAEIAPDLFAVSSDSTIYTADLNVSPPNVTTLVRIQDTTLNGMLYLPPPANRIMCSDSSGGVVWSVDAANPVNNYGITLWDESMFPVPGARRSLVGVNGIRYNAVTGHVHYVNLPKLLYMRVPVDPATGRATGPYEVLAEGVMADDFALDAESGDAYLAGLDRNVVYRVGATGRTEVVAGGPNSTELAGATSAAFGRTGQDRRVLYVTTGGAVAAPVNGTYTEGGKVVAVELR
ncbi:hypothetical protein B0J12DRAFT_714263 [Macrophomina phaseolina]|uniref:Six-bladed beta-propeller TolB-like protein n=1 Tax=Macrophomina phaseolina TaxID=35725 RepID=A0ABQ8FU30_9PEZI|nr:hypothetical protein B0J12DRAFT_714263 [Macrophomina phaseolina]